MLLNKNNLNLSFKIITNKNIDQFHVLCECLKIIIMNRCFKHDLCYKKHLVMLNAFLVNANLRQCVSMMQNKNWVSSGEAQLKKMHSINKIISKHSV